MAETTNHRGLFAALLGGAVGAGIGVTTGLWWGHRVPGHIYRDGDDWYADGPVLRELQRRIRGSGGTQWQGGYNFSLLGHGSIKLVPTQRSFPDQSGQLYFVESVLSRGQEIEFVMLDLVAHRVGKLRLIHYTPRPMPGRMVQGPDLGPDEPSAAHETQKQP